LSEQEWLAPHVDVKAIQQEFGLSYKDGAHHLYLAEITRLKTLERAHRALSYVQQRIDKVFRCFSPYLDSPDINFDSGPPKSILNHNSVNSQQILMILGSKSSEIS